MKFTNSQQFLDYANQVHIKCYSIFPNISSILLHMFTVLGNGYKIENGFLVTQDKMTKKSNKYIKKTVNKILADNPSITTYDFIQIISDNTRYPELLSSLHDYGYIRRFDCMRSLYDEDEWAERVVELYNKRKVVPFETFTQDDIFADTLIDRMLQEMIDTKDGIYPMPSRYFIFNECGKETPKWLVTLALCTISAVLKYIESDTFIENKDNRYYPKEYYVTEYTAMYNTILNLLRTCS